MTIFGNKMSGCASDGLGFALYVNEWEKSDGLLWLEWGDGIVGCNKVTCTNNRPTDKEGYNPFLPRKYEQKGVYQTRGLDIWTQMGSMSGEVRLMSLFEFS